MNSVYIYSESTVSFSFCIGAHTLLVNLEVMQSLQGKTIWNHLTSDIALEDELR